MITIADMIAKCSNSQLTQIIVSGTNEAKKNDKNMVQLAVLVLSELYKILRNDVIKWLASLINMTEDDFLKTPPATVLEIFEQLIDGENNSDFFLQAYALFKKISTLNITPKTK